LVNRFLPVDESPEKNSQAENSGMLLLNSILLFCYLHIMALQVIWMTTPPISTDIRSGILIGQLEFQQQSMRFNIMAANQCAASIVASYGYDVLGKFFSLMYRKFAQNVV
jgi:hypothetical protein